MPTHSKFQSDRNSARTWSSLALVGTLAIAVAGCDPMLERKYMDEGAGATLYTPELANQTALLDDYFNYLCLQARSSCVDYVVLVQAGMNDIDQRCDGYLTWLDARRRDKAPFLAELSAVQTAVHSVMTVTGSSPQSLNILTAAFGLATATYTQWNSRLLISLENSTVQEVVYTSQGKYREQIGDWAVPDRPSAVYLLRNYLRLCMPITIEANVNTSTQLVKRGAVAAAQQSVVVKHTTPTPTMGVQRRGTRSDFGADDNTSVLRKFTFASTANRAIVISFLQGMNLRERDIPRFLSGAEYASQRRQLVNQLKDQGKL